MVQKSKKELISNLLYSFYQFFLFRFPPVFCIAMSEQFTPFLRQASSANSSVFQRRINENLKSGDVQRLLCNVSNVCNASTRTAVHGSTFFGSAASFGCLCEARHLASKRCGADAVYRYSMCSLCVPCFTCAPFHAFAVTATGTPIMSRAFQ